MRWFLLLLYGLLALTFLAGCQTGTVAQRNNSLTHGNVTLTLRKGVTTQAEVLETFGAPNIATINSEGDEVWTYQRHASVAESNSGYATVIVFGASTAGFSRSSRTITLIIKFDQDHVVREFRSMTSEF